jgi:hypothetical protein
VASSPTRLGSSPFSFASVLKRPLFPTGEVPSAKRYRPEEGIVRFNAEASHVAKVCNINLASAAPFDSVAQSKQSFEYIWHCINGELPFEKSFSVELKELRRYRTQESQHRLSEVIVYLEDGDFDAAIAAVRDALMACRSVMACSVLHQNPDAAAAYMNVFNSPSAIFPTAPLAAPPPPAKVARQPAKEKSGAKKGQAAKSVPAVQPAFDVFPRFICSAHGANASHNSDKCRVLHPIKSETSRPAPAPASS